MVEQNVLNNVFKSLADPTRRDILARVNERQHTISELAQKYKMSFAGIAKHVNILQNAQLVTKSRSGKEQIISINGDSLQRANDYLQSYAKLWGDSLNRLDSILKEK